MAISRKYVLCFGKDEVLLATRLKLLVSAGYQAIATMDMLAVWDGLLSEDVSVLVLCHTVTREDVNEIAELHAEVKSSTAILCLSKGPWSPTPKCAARHEVPHGPAAFLAAVGRLSVFPVGVAGDKSLMGVFSQGKRR